MSRTPPDPPQYPYAATTGVSTRGPLRGVRRVEDAGEYWGATLSYGHAVERRKTSLDGDEGVPVERGRLSYRVRSHSRARPAGSPIPSKQKTIDPRTDQLMALKKSQRTA